MILYICNMTATIDNLERIVRNYSKRIEAIPDEVLLVKPGPGKWSKKEIIGHLVDSAQNNIRRFIVAQYEYVPTIVYQQDAWVALSGYQDYPSANLVALWRLLNLHMVSVLRQVSLMAASRKCDTRSAQVHTIEWLAADYCNHLLHHLHQVLDLDPIAYP